MASDSSILNVLANAIGPAPWYWKTFPEFNIRGRRLTWSCNNNALFSVNLHPEGKPELSVLSIARYARVFPLPPNLLGIWFEDGLCIRIVALDPERLPEFATNDSSSDAVLDYGKFRCCGEVLGEFFVSRDLEVGEYRIDLPPVFAGLEHLLLIGEYARVQETACAAIFEIRFGVSPSFRCVCVYPQKWYTRDNFDLGYQWITRVARDPAIGRFVGEGIGINPFILTEDGCHIERTITA